MVVLLVLVLVVFLEVAESHVMEVSILYCCIFTFCAGVAIGAHLPFFWGGGGGGNLASDIS